MAPGLKGLYVYVGSSDTTILSSMSTHAPLDAQLSSSWTWEPSDPKTDDPYFEKFAAQGQNYFQAAGDSRRYTAGSQYVWPAGFRLRHHGRRHGLESRQRRWCLELGTPWSDGGGGFYKPDAIKIPAWQQLTGVITATNEGSQTLRNSPDVSAEANFDFYSCADQEPCQEGWGGTSFATPMWAGYMALINQQAVANGHPTLGFVNPADLCARRGARLSHRLPRHHQREQWLSRCERLRFGYRLGQPKREISDHCPCRIGLAACGKMSHRDGACPVLEHQ